MATQRELEIANMKRMDRIERKIDAVRGLVEDLLDIKSDAEKEENKETADLKPTKAKKDAK